MATNKSLSRTTEAKKVDINLDLNESDMMMIMMVVMMSVIMTAMLPRIVSAATSTAVQSLQTLQTMQYQGKSEARVVQVPSDRVVYIDLLHDRPFTPWTWVLLENNGPYEVEIGINEPNDRFVLVPGANKTIDRLTARERISIIFFYCRPTETAEVKVTGEY